MLDHNSAQYDIILLAGDLNLETTEKHMERFCDICYLKNLVKETACFKNPYLELFLNCSKSFQGT